jgi:hypothetical protein
MAGAQNEPQAPGTVPPALRAGLSHRGGPIGERPPGAIKAVAVCDAPDYLMMRSRLPGLVIDSASLYSPGT